MLEPAISAYLEPYGYEAAGPTEWAIPSPSRLGRPTKLYLKASGHIEARGHTFYLVSCSLRIPDHSPLDWEVARRLRDLREQLHDPVKLMLDKVYKWHFRGAHFAPRGGLPGTTSRLQSWLCALADCINKNEASPRVVALVLSFLRAPDPEQALLDATVHDEEIQVHMPVDLAEVLDRSLVEFLDFLIDRFSSLEEAFNALAPDGRHMLVYANFVSKMQELGFEPDLTVVWNRLDHDGNGEIHFRDFTTICTGEMHRLRHRLNLESDDEAGSEEAEPRDTE